MTDATPPALIIHSIPVGPRLVKVIQLAYEARVSLLIEGETGIGKSAILKHAAERLGIDYEVLDLSVLDACDLLGLPEKKNGMTIWATPKSLPHTLAGILVLEEINRADRQVVNPMLQLLTARRVHEYRLPDGWIIVALINPETAHYDVNPLDRALRARFLRVVVHADRVAWLEWASASGIHPAILRLAHAQDRILADVEPRKWTRVSDLLRAMKPEQRRDPAWLHEVLAHELPAAWLQLLLQESLLRSDDCGLDARVLLTEYDRDPALRKTLLGLVQAGRTDCIDRAYREIHGILGQASLAGGGFRLPAFERLLRDLPGDLREALQEAFGDQPDAPRLLGFDPARALARYGRSRWRRHVKDWRGDPAFSHRLRALVRATARHVERSEPAELTGTPGRRGLDLLIQDLGPEHAAPLTEALRRRGAPPPPFR